ncbi:hypothetical protein HRI_002317500 [Hibiscus trionum]|uniref:Endonuclease/exonuclease/phosphatase domain-containing protein n=1 Tax=Hibiscus trionum TaxID=183268 RepID=A0A9W7I000_HIBTR|nr:hypothetical protein HRI_002317500 [Hibiscus trionum]
MNLCFLSWNVRGLGRREKVRAVSKKIRDSKARIVFLQETKLDAQKLSTIKRIGGRRLREVVVSSASRAAGGLVTLWDDKVFTAEKSIVCERVVIIIGTLVEEKLRIGLCNVYAPNVQSERREYWSFLKEAMASVEAPIIMGGDFNAIRSWEEKFGASSLCPSMRAFDEFIVESGLVDLPLKDGIYTWMRGGNTNSASRLDRFLVPPEIVDRWPSIGQFCLTRSLSDHNLILLRVEKGKRGPQPFKYFDFWADDPCYTDIVKSTIDNCSERGVADLLKKIKLKSKDWVKQKRLKEEASVADVEERIAVLESRAVTDTNSKEVWEEIKAFRTSLWDLNRKEEREWLQKSRLKWFQEGDKNTKFFHMTASLRRSCNSI